MDLDLQSGETRRTRWAGLSATCRCRAVNEDAFAAFEEAEVFVVADGCGGGGAGSGRRAAEIAISCFGDGGGAAAGLTERGAPYRVSSPPCAPLLGPPADPLAWAVVAANRLIFEDSVRDQRYRGQGCALAAIRLQPRWLAIAHVGDCRVGLLRRETFTWLTEDHTLWVDIQKAGAPLEEVERVRREHSTVITKALGGGETIEVELAYRQLLAGDTLLLCSDGLWRGVVKATIHCLIEDRQRPLVDQCRALYSAVEAAGGHDNATVILVEVTSPG